jgi:hypothetical protein
MDAERDGDGTSADEQEAVVKGAPASILASRIAIDTEPLPPTLAALGLEEAKVQAFAWQQQRSHARINDLHGHLSGKAGGRWVVEVHGIFGIVAEQVLVAIEAEAEKVICLQAIEEARQGEHASLKAHYFRSLRFFAEGQANAIVIACHGLANIVLRSLEFDTPLGPDELKALRIRPSTFAPRSDANSAWISMSEESVAALTIAAGARSQSARAMCQALSEIYAAQPIRTLMDLRNVQYHRWRGESPGVTGVTRSGQTVSETLLSGQAFSMTRDLLPDYLEGDARVDQLVSGSRRALDSLVSHMEVFHLAWYDAFVDGLAN